MKRSLKRLVKLGVVVKKGKKMYAAYLEKQEGSDDDDDDDEGSSIDEGTLEAADDDDAANNVVPMAQRIREAHEEQQFISPSIPKKKIYLDDEIARLEAELAADSYDEDIDIDESSSATILILMHQTTTTQRRQYHSVKILYMNIRRLMNPSNIRQNH